MSATETIESTAEEIDAPATAAPEPSRELTVTPLVATGAIIRGDDPADILAKARQIATPLADLIESAGLSVALDKRNPERKHVEVGGWQATGTLLGALGGQPLHAETVWTRRVADEHGGLQRTTYTATVRRFHSRQQGGGLREETTYEVDGYDWEACVEVKTAAGVVVGRAEAMVSRAENTWARRDDYALRSMAETRAESRAWRKAIGWIVHLAGYNPTPAEEMGHTPGADTTPATNPEPPAWAGPATDEHKAAMLAALVHLIGERSVAVEYAQALGKACGGAVPDVVADWASALPAFMEAGAARANAAQAKRQPAPAQAATQPPADEGVERLNSRELRKGHRVLIGGKPSEVVTVDPLPEGMGVKFTHRPDSHNGRPPLPTATLRSYETLVVAPAKDSDDRG